MTCQELVEQLLEFLSGELEGDCCEEIRQHLHQCSPCEAYYQTYRLTITLSRKLPQREMSIQFAEKLRVLLIHQDKSE